MLAILTTHPIQYQVPLWRALAEDGRVPFEVWYLTRHGSRPSFDPEFGETFAWDFDMLSGYPHRFLQVADGAGPSSFRRCRLKESLRHRIRSTGTQALWIQGWQVAAYWQAVREARCAGAEVWLRAETNDLARRSWSREALNRLKLKWLFPRIDRYFYIGSANRRLYKKFGVPDERLYPATYAVDNDLFSRQANLLKAERSTLRRAWGIAEDAFCVLFCGKFIGKKRPMDVVDAARKLLRERKLQNLHLLFVGSGQLGGSLRSQCRVVFEKSQENAPPETSANQDEFRPVASFTGFLNQTEISRAYVAADCLVLPSDQGETWGLVVNEALASGLPCLVSDACGSAEDLVRSYGFSFPLADIDCLAKKLLNVATRVGLVPTPPSISETVSSLVDAYCQLKQTVDRPVPPALARCSS